MDLKIPTIDNPSNGIDKYKHSTEPLSIADKLRTKE